MKPSMVILLVGIVAAACAACAQTPASAPSQVGAKSLPTWPLTTCKADTFAGSVLTLPSYAGPYDGQQFIDPIGASTLEQGAPIYQDLLEAFSAAPSNFQAKLCGLNGVFIDQKSCSSSEASSCSILNSWGFRNPTNGKRYIGLSASLWASGRAKPYSDYETDVLTQIILILTPHTTYPSNPPHFSPASPEDSSEITVLAALAHEFGHVLWFDVIKGAPTNSKYEPNDFCNKSFFKNAWREKVTQPPDFTPFSWLQDNHTGVEISDLVSTINQPNPDVGADTARMLLKNMYSPDSGGNKNNGVWASLLGAHSPEEDFVETFKTYILINSSFHLDSLPLNVYGPHNSPQIPKPDIYADLKKGKKTELKRKLDCFQGVL